ncbi:outer membrane protein assembly factor BamC [Aquabacterium sp. OR-4]|uniref:outer membrane protein assembly factor BamC n=1 Tax=Aquabacterium sp. OR-4 TaxID=2978127 RepID=UPI0021B20B1F|nr:outer membrane protein assembly factor BamC [Aquabacterium sp. OR-4]MDT7835235.1 outer membrane protein assembly factor BamC [Aquabacterium sp. OR-4]
MNAPFAVTPLRCATLALAWALAGCSTLDGSLSLGGDNKVDYRSQSAKTQPLDIPPDLTQLARDGRYQPQGGVVSAAAMRQPAGTAPAAGTTAAPGTPAVAPAAVGDVRLVRQGSERWLATGQAPEKVLPLLRSFWQERGFTLVVDDAQLGILETDWAENRAKLPQDLVRRTLGRVLENLYDTGTRDRFRVRIERSAEGGSEVYLTHRGLEEVYLEAREGQTAWRPRAQDRDLEAEFLNRMMLRLGGKDEATQVAAAKTAPATPAAPPAGARPAPSAGTETAITLPEGFDRAWRQVGLALDRSGFSVEDRDRSAGVYFVRYIDPKFAGREEPNFFAKLFGGGAEAKPVRYRVLVKSEGNASRVSVLTSAGEAETGDAARQIIARLSDALK